ncbi:MAG: AsnC family transcriptional regulator [Nitrosotalea sp.]
MPYKLDDIDTAILRSLFKDGRKSFRQISREIKVSTPTVKARYQRLVNVGLIKGIFPTLNLDKLENKTCSELGHIKVRSIKENSIKLGSSLRVKLNCDYCHGPVAGKPTALKFASFERFFCCRSCRALYKEKYRSKIASMSSFHQDGRKA